MNKRERISSPANARKRQTRVSASECSSDAGSDTSSGTETDPMLQISSSSSSTSTSTLSPRSHSGSSVGTTTHEEIQSPEHTGHLSVVFVPSTVDEAEDSQPAITMCADLDATGIVTPESMSESSPEATVISPQAANGLLDPSSTSLTLYTTQATFPIFSSGDVFIVTDLVSPRKVWQLHSAMLARHSPWFAQALWRDADGSTKRHPWSYFMLEEFDGNVALVQQKVPEGRLFLGNRHREIGGHIIKIEKVEDTSNEAGLASPPATDAAASKMYHTTTVDHYNQIFASFYAVPITIQSETLVSMLIACESLTLIASSLSCVPHISPHLSNHLLSHRQVLFRAIAHDPLRYLLLALALRNVTIYTEALIHIIGAHPAWPWPSKRCDMPDKILEIVRNKSKELDELCIETERELLLLTVRIRERSVSPDEPGEFDTWFIVSLLRNYLADKMIALDTLSNAKRALHRGNFFRTLRRGGSAYMEYGEMRRRVAKSMPSAVDTLEEDLMLLKKYVKGYVEDVARNETCMAMDGGVDGEEGDGVVGWLTCAKVGAKEIPWLGTENREG